MSRATPKPNTPPELAAQLLAVLGAHPSAGDAAAGGNRRARKQATGALIHELVEATGATRYRVSRTLAELVESGAVFKSGSRYHLPAGLAAPAAPEGQAQAPRPAAAGPAREPQAASAPAEPRPPSAAPRRGDEHAARPWEASGVLRVHPAGYGFVQRDDGEEDVFVSAKNRGTALDSDKVAVNTWVGYKGTEGRVVRVLARGRARLSGTVGRLGRRFHLVPDDPRLTAQQSEILLPDGAGGAYEGQSVLAEITRYPSHPQEPLAARVLQVLGEPEQPAVELAKILLVADVPNEFPDAVRTAGERAPSEVRPQDFVDRLDLRDRPFLTIDPETARDFDDAVCAEQGLRPGIDRLWVAVADVAHYVVPGSPLEQEARVRGSSVYLPDRVISMLPLQLSAGICSLNPDVDRCAMVVALDIDESGQVVGESFAAAVIRSHARLDYPGVAAALEGEQRGGAQARYREHLPQLRQLRTIAGRLRQRRLQRGALDFDLPEAKVLLDEANPGVVRDVVRARTNPEIRGAYRLVEDCMLAANEAVARFFKRRDLPCVYRVHDVPDEERLLAFAALAKSHGLRFDPLAAREPKYLRGFLEQLQGRPMEQALSYLLLRALKKATYDTQTLGHFGLAAPDYLHFTSPIRRYPDLLVHRLLKQRLRREGLPAGGVVTWQPASPEELQQAALDSSKAERRAMEVEREVVDMYRACLMLDQVGQEYDGAIVGVTAFGIFVAIDSPYVEGLIKTERLGGGYEFDPQTLRLFSRHGRSYSLGDAVRVRVDSVSVTRRKIDFTLVEEPRRPPASTEELADAFWSEDELEGRAWTPLPAQRPERKSRPQQDMGERGAGRAAAEGPAGPRGKGPFRGRKSSHPRDDRQRSDEAPNRRGGGGKKASKPGKGGKPGKRK